MLFALLLALLSPPPPVPPAVTRAPLPGPDQVVTRIGFGSCLVQVLPLHILDQMAAERWDLFLFSGDNVYADLAVKDGEAKAVKGDPRLMREAYQTLTNVPAWQRFAATTPILATWDDHDYGENDAGADFAHRAFAEHQFETFFPLSGRSGGSDLRLERPGVYVSQRFGPPGRRLQIILLDTRYFRTPLERTEQMVAGNRIYRAKNITTATVLGEAQWLWLEKQFQQPADLRILVSSIQVLAADMGEERWSNFPEERRRLLALINQNPSPTTLILSGDRHYAAVYQAPRDKEADLVEITSSSLNMARSGHAEQAPLQQGAVYSETNYGQLTINWPRRQILATLNDEHGRQVRQTLIGF